MGIINKFSVWRKACSVGLSLAEISAPHRCGQLHVREAIHINTSTMAKKDKKSHTASLLTVLHKCYKQHIILLKTQHYLAVDV